MFRFPLKEGISSNRDRFINMSLKMCFIIHKECRIISQFTESEVPNEIRQTKDFIEYWVKPNFREVTSEWKHMVMCIFEGVVYMDLPSNYKVFVLYLCDILEFNMLAYGSFSLLEKILYALQKFMFSYMMKLLISIVNKVINTCLNRAAAFKGVKHAELKKKLSKISRICTA